MQIYGNAFSLHYSICNLVVGFRLKMKPLFNDFYVGVSDAVARGDACAVELEQSALCGLAFDGLENGVVLDVGELALCQDCPALPVVIGDG